MQAILQCARKPQAFGGFKVFWLGKDITDLKRAMQHTSSKSARVNPTNYRASTNALGASERITASTKTTLLLLSGPLLERGFTGSNSQSEQQQHKTQHMAVQPAMLLGIVANSATFAI